MNKRNKQKSLVAKSYLLQVELAIKGIVQCQGGALTCQLLAPLLSPGGQDQPDLIGSIRCPESNKKPLGQSTILYDYSEEELMASIEREYCR
ncbi:hypothetical protein TURU_140460 [Turdus rufiventris]|nr:hypothetical protein TURU_140460 [Turdus rufiventris]